MRNIYFGIQEASFLKELCSGRRVGHPVHAHKQSFKSILFYFNPTRLCAKQIPYQFLQLFFHTTNKFICVYTYVAL